MSDTREQLRTYIDSMYEPVSVDEVMDRKRSRHSSRGGRRLALVVVPLVVLVAVVGVLATIVARDDTSSRVDTAAPRQAPRGTWETVPGAESGLDPGATVGSVVPFHEGLVAVGMVLHLKPTSPSALPFQAAIWTSPDGRHWSRVTSQSFGEGSFVAVVVRDNTLFAFATPQGGGSGSVWSSDDGANWRLVTDRAPDAMQTVIVHHGRFVAAGSASTSCEGSAPGCLRPRFWTSVDGQTWASRPAGGVRSGYVSELGATSDGVVAIGMRVPRRASSKASPEALVWTSRNGAQWHLVAPEDGLGRNVLVASALDHRRSRFLALGYKKTSATSRASTSTSTTTTRPAVAATSSNGTSTTVRICGELAATATAWTSATGRDWTVVEPRGLDVGAVSRLLAAHTWWFAAGSQGDCNGTRATVFMSRDGRHWTEAISDPPTTATGRDGPARRVTALGKTPSGAIAFASALPGTEDDALPDVWIWSP